ncbi:Type IV pilus assembly protein PilZ [Nitrosococcus oceani AFC27]|nr:Type IV pilus assembly protein PilZ [Nitrosococcus oceani AFC27]KFI20818.1 pilus assembly protein PilZ [Nitrosococcus oceani C-27]KFI23912.1 pilus assembly protein PilZ [Nitrosococcus oceani]
MISSYDHSGSKLAVSRFLSKKMERRQNSRRQSAVKVYLSWPGQESQCCRVKNLSATGAFIEVGALRIPEDRIIKLAFVLPINSLIKIHRLSAIVVHRSHQGLGLMFQQV